MLTTPRAIAFFLATSVSLLTVAFLSLVPETPQRAMVVAGFLSFSSCFLLSYLLLEFVFFREIYQLYQAIDQLRKKDLKKARKRLAGSSNPLRELRKEIFKFTHNQDRLIWKQEQEIDELKQLEVYRREFLADVSHELKTPVFAAQGFLHTLLDGAIDDEQYRYHFLQKAAKSMDDLNDLVQELLTLSRMENGAISMNCTAFDGLELLAEVRDQLEQQANDRGMSILLNSHGLSRAPVFADRMRIRQVLTNLITNSIKYGNDGGTINLSLASLERGVEFSIRDNGPGIAPEHQEKIFDRLYRIEKSRSKGRGGSGLGLAIVKQVILSHNSEIKVESALGKGTRFYFVLDSPTQHHWQQNPNQEAVGATR